MSDSDSFSVQGDDREINAAISEAQRRLPEFRRIIEEDSRRIIPVYAAPLAKICVESPISGAIEHLWLEGVYFDGEEVRGSVLTAPHDIPEIEKGGEVKAPVSRITDWMYYEGDTLHGGFVENVLKKRES